MPRHSHLLALPLILALVACGGGGGGSSIASAPPPPLVAQPTQSVQTLTTRLTPLEPTNGLIAGTFNTLAIVEQRQGDAVTFLKTASDQVRITIDPATMTYTVKTSVPGLLAEKAFDMGHVSHGLCCADTQAEFGYHVVKTDSNGTVVESYDVTSGTSRGNNFQLTGAPNQAQYYLLYDLGLRYVSLGVWSQIDWKQVGPSSFQQVSTPNKIYFVNGSRTAAADIPVSGTATYKLAEMIVSGPTEPSSLDNNGVGDALAGVPQTEMANVLKLVADFGASRISADLNVPGRSIDPGDSVGGYSTHYSSALRATGTATFSGANDFNIPVLGEVLLAPGTAPYGLSGNILAGFYGPNADNVGGLIQLTPQGGSTVTVPFAAQKQ